MAEPRDGDVKYLTVDEIDFPVGEIDEKRAFPWGETEEQRLANIAQIRTQSHGLTISLELLWKDFRKRCFDRIVAAANPPGNWPYMPNDRAPDFADQFLDALMGRYYFSKSPPYHPRIYKLELLGYRAMTRRERAEHFTQLLLEVLEKVEFDLGLKDSEFRTTVGTSDVYKDFIRVLASVVERYYEGTAFW